MYEAVRTRAPISSKAVGVVTMVLVTGSAGYALANGFGARWAETFHPATTVATLEPDRKPVEEPPPSNLDTTVDAPTPPLPPPPTETFDPPDRPPPITLPPVRPIDEIGPGRNGLTPPPLAPVRKMPVLIAKDKPPYPPVAIRAQWVGVSELTACVDAKGRVTSLSITKTSGHDVLDEAALEWVRSAKFSPGTIDGQPQPMCDARVIYDWRLDR